MFLMYNFHLSLAALCNFVGRSFIDVLKPDLVSVVTAHRVYFFAFARSEIFQKNARKLGVGRGQFDAGVSGLTHNWFHASDVLVMFSLQFGLKTPILHVFAARPENENS